MQFDNKVNPDRSKLSREAGFTVILICCLLGLVFRQNQYFLAIIVVTVLALTVPVALYPFAIAWTWLATLLGSISSRILLSVIFFLVVLPVAWLRRKSAYRSFALKQFKKNNRSAMKIRDHQYSAEDFLHTF